MSTQDIVQKLWNLCNVLRDDGITYHQYVTELTYILFLKMLEETGEEAALRKEIEQAYKKRLEQYAKSRGKRVDELTEEERNGRKNALYDYSWKYLTSLSGIALKKYYNVILTELGKTTMPKISNIYTKAVSSIEEPKNLEKLINMNSYFQNANTGTAVVWRDWKYKVGDHILFNDTDRFSLLYNNLKGRIVQIELFDSRIRFTVDVEIPLTEQDCQNDGIEFIDIIDDVTRIRFDVLDFEEEMADEDRKKAIVPFQLAYAVSIHKAQGLEYRSVKVVIPSSNAEKITHGIFYTAITRAKEKLKIYWSSETMQEVVAGFSVDTSKQKSLAIIKEKLKQDKNT